MVCSILLLSSIPLYGYIIICSFNHPLKDVWVVSSFGLLGVEVAMNIHVQVSEWKYVLYSGTYMQE